jgi:DNA modification methylase
LAEELQALLKVDFDLDVIGFSESEVAFVLDGVVEADADLDQAVLVPPGEPVTRPGDLWEIGDHRLVCGDARDEVNYNMLLCDEQVDLIFTDPPYNIAPKIRGKAATDHSPFAMGAGELSKPDFIKFLTVTLGNCAERARDGAIAFVFMDWRHMGELIAAGESVFSEQKNLCFWNKGNGGMGKFYRSQHELVFVYKVRPGRHQNNFGMGGGGRYRTNVWDYPGLNGFGKQRGEQLRLHPTVKPVALVADAIKDCSARRAIVLDAFAGSGTTLVAAQTCGRRSRLIEIEPKYCDVALARAETLFGLVPIHVESGMSFAGVRKWRS